jgi:hypothetical protein
MSLDVSEQGTRNEQFIAAALGVETLAGFFGFAYPQAIARHAYANDGPLDPATRLRRVGILSVGYAITSDAGALRPRRWEDRLNDPYPGGIDGDRVAPVPGARPRVMQPARAIAVIGDPDGEALYALLDAPGLRTDRVTLLSFDGADPPTAEELSACDAVVLAGDAAARVLAPTGDALRVSLPLDAASLARLQALAVELSASVAVRAESSVPEHFERVASDAVRAKRDDADARGWLVLSETWSLYGGWDVRSDQGRALTLRRADGVASAVLLQPGETGIEARYRPASVRHGLLLGALGLLGVLALLWPRRAAPLA